MQINSTSNIQDQYFNVLQSKQKEIATKSFEEELTKESTTETVETSSSVKSVDEQQPERYHEVLTYANTKGMTDKEVDEYFSERSEEEKSHIKFLIHISNNFSEDDTVNEVIFQEASTKTTLRQRQDFSSQIARESRSFSLGAPTLTDVLRVSDEWLAASRTGIENTQELGIFMNALDKAHYENGNKFISYTETKLTAEASGFLSTMLNLAQQRMDEARGTAVYDDYKGAFERYQRLNDNYNSLLAQKEESNLVDIQV